MSLRNCADCGNVFNYRGNPLCPECIKKDEEDFATVRKYLREHPGASVVEVAEATEIEEEKILRYVREGRLQSKSWVGVVECVRCGRKISEGRYCSVCQGEVAKQVQTVVPRIKAPEPEIKKSVSRGGERMFIKERDK